MASARGNLWRSDSNNIVSFSEIDTLILMTVSALIGLNAMPLEWMSQIVSESRMRLHSYTLSNTPDCKRALGRNLRNLNAANHSMGFAH
jgi:hypothetical protein